MSPRPRLPSPLYPPSNTISCLPPCRGVNSPIRNASEYLVFANCECRSSSMAEHRFRKAGVMGSTPIFGFLSLFQQSPSSKMPDYRVFPNDLNDESKVRGVSQNPALILVVGKQEGDRLVHLLVFGPSRHLVVGDVPGRQVVGQHLYLWMSVGGSGCRPELQRQVGDLQLACRVFVVAESTNADVVVAGVSNESARA